MRAIGAIIQTVGVHKEKAREFRYGERMGDKRDKRGFEEKGNEKKLVGFEGKMLDFL